jgi:predicted RNA methylase
MTRWSVGLEAEGDREMSHDEILALADAVAGDGGIASGIGTSRYGAQLVVVADSRDEAVEAARASFTAAARSAKLPEWPVVRVAATSEEDDVLGE